MINNFLNYIFFQSGWLGVVYYRNIWTALLCIILASLNFFLTNQKFLKSILIGLFIASIGIVNDWTLKLAGIISFPYEYSFVVPFWLCSLWFLFISTFTGCASWLKSSHIITLALLGAIGGSFSYCIATKLGACTYNLNLMPQSVFHALNWLILFPILYKLFWKLINLHA